MESNEEFTLGGVKLLKDEDGYGVAHLTEEGAWEVVANFKYVGSFISFIVHHLKELQDRESALRSVQEQLGLMMETQTNEETKEE